MTSRRAAAPTEAVSSVRGRDPDVETKNTEADQVAAWSALSFTSLG